jgi:hypothetical protein
MGTLGVLITVCYVPLFSNTPGDWTSDPLLSVTLVCIILILYELSLKYEFPFGEIRSK